MKRSTENGHFSQIHNTFAEAPIALYGRSIPAITEALISGDAATLGEVDTLSAADRIACFDILCNLCNSNLINNLILF